MYFKHFFLSAFAIATHSLNFWIFLMLRVQADNPSLILSLITLLKTAWVASFLILKYLFYLNLLMYFLKVMERIEYLKIWFLKRFFILILILFLTNTLRMLCSNLFNFKVEARLFIFCSLPSEADWVKSLDIKHFTSTFWNVFWQI